MFEVIFDDLTDEGVVVEQKFASYEEADQWARDKEYDYQDIAIDGEGNDYWETFYRYYNPETNESGLYGYEIKEIKK